jgi:hypothetical protein
MLVPATPPKVTATAPRNPLPVTVTSVPPNIGPPPGLIPDTQTTLTYVKRSAKTGVLLPDGVVTTTSTVPAAWVGDQA